MEPVTVDLTAALVAVDLQHVTVGLPSAHDMTTVVANVARLATAFRERGLTVVLTRADLNHPPAGRTTYSDRSRPPVPTDALALVPEVGSGERDVVVDKRGWGAFAGTGLDDQLRTQGISQVVVVGLATGFGVESTARQAYDLGYDVVIVADAVNNPDAAGHTHSIERVFPALGLVTTTDAVLAGLPAAP